MVARSKLRDLCIVIAFTGLGGLAGKGLHSYMEYDTLNQIDQAKKDIAQSSPHYNYEAEDRLKSAERSHAEQDSSLFYIGVGCVVGLAAAGLHFYNRNQPPPPSEERLCHDL